MSERLTIETELLAIITNRPGSKSAEIYERSTLAQTQHTVYQGLYRLKQKGQIEKRGEGYFVADGVEAPADLDLGWGEDKTERLPNWKAPKSPANDEPDEPKKPEAPKQSSAPADADRFDLLLDALLNAAEDSRSGPGMNELARLVREAMS